jgi:hypothetical protein
VEPPLTALAVNVTPVPEHMAVALDIILMLGVTFDVTLIVIEFEVAVLVV